MTEQKYTECPECGGTDINCFYTSGGEWFHYMKFMTYTECPECGGTTFERWLYIPYLESWLSKLTTWEKHNGPPIATYEYLGHFDEHIVNVCDSCETVVS